MNRQRQATLAAILCLLFFSATATFAQTHESLPYYIEWEPVEGAGGYDIEVTTASGAPTLVKRLGAGETSVDLNLPAGKYRFRISTLNKFLRADSTSDWVPFTVLSYGPPNVSKISPTAIAPGKPLSITITADMVSAKATGFLSSPSGKRIPLSISKAKPRTYLLTGQTLTERGEYALTLTNPPEYATVKKAAIVVAYPAVTALSSAPERVSRETLSASGDQGSAPTVLTVRGKNLSPEATAWLKEPGTENAIPLSPLTRSPTELTLGLPPTLGEGTYVIAFKNAPDLGEMAAGTLVVEKKPEPKQEEPLPKKEPVAEKPPKEEKNVEAKATKNWLCVGVDGGLGLILGEWNDVYSEPGIAGAAFADFYLSPRLVPESGRGFLYAIGLRADFAVMHNDGNGIYVESDTQDLAITLAPSITYALPRFRFRFRLGGGINLIKVTAKDIAAGSDTDKSSLDGAITAGLTVEFLPFERFAIGFDNELLYITNQDPLTRYAGTLGVSYAIPIKR